LIYKLINKSGNFSSTEKTILKPFSRKFELYRFLAGLLARVLLFTFPSWTNSGLKLITTTNFWLSLQLREQLRI